MKKPMAIISLVAGFPVAAIADADGSVVLVPRHSRTRRVLLPSIRHDH